MFHSSNLDSVELGFSQATTWYDEIYIATILSRNRYRVACCILVLMVLLLMMMLCLLIPTQHLIPLMINHYTDGRVDVVPMPDNQVPKNQAMRASDLVRYVTNRESYDANAYAGQYALVNQLSTDAVARQYQHEQSVFNHSSPLWLMKKGGYRDIFIDSVLVLDNKKHLAQVNFVRNDHDRYQRVSNMQPMTALITWAYHRPSQNPGRRWLNWNGFIVTSYHAVQRYVK